MINVTLMQAGYCTHPEFIVRQGGQWQSVPFPAMFALLEHPKLGPILFDTGYTPRFFRATQRFPYSLYAKTTPVYLSEGQSAQQQLNSRGVAAEDIRYVIISHFHADHIAGLTDFPNAYYIYASAAYEAVRHKKGFAALRAGFLPTLLPADFEQRSLPFDLKTDSPPNSRYEATQKHDILPTMTANYITLPPDYAPLKQGVDLWADGSLIAVALPGHAEGQIGLLLQAEGWGATFLVADACWQSDAYRHLIWPHPLANLILADPRAYRDTLTKLHHLHKNNPKLRIIPSHCQEVYRGTA